MSLILEALKKSETERRVGELPGLMTPAGLRHGRRSSGWPVLLALLMLIAVVAGGAWWLFARDQAAVDTAPIAGTASLPESPAAVDDGSGEPSLQREIQRRRVAAANAALPPAAVERSGTTRAPTERESTPQQPSQLPPPPTPLPRPEVEPTATPDTVTAEEPPTAASEPPPGANDAAATVPDSTSTLNVGAEAAGLPSLRQLPAATRDQLPPLKISMYVYNQGEASRFLLVDGRRVLEGQRIAEGLVLVEVRRHDAVLEFEGERFLLPRP